MPCFRGLDISVLVRPQSERLPEFPHPDGSSVCVSVSSPLSVNDKRASISTLDSGSLQKANPRISVYIPSIADAQFTVNYAVLRAPEPSCQLFFKLLINGRHITSWGVNPIHQPTGTVSRALYEPCELWHHSEGSTTFRADGIEARSFFFSPSSSSSSIADDGGVIEVHVFRAQGKRRRTMRLEKYRRQDHYGVLSPSDGLLEDPERMAYFDWELIDPKATPFATFQFHYRDWNVLQQLSLIPTEATTRTESYPLPRRWQGTESSEVACSMPDQARNPSISPNSRYRYASQAVSELAAFSALDEQVLGFASTKVTQPRKSGESIPTTKAASVATSLLSYVEDSSDESSAELGTAVGVQLRGSNTHLITGQRPLPQTPMRQGPEAEMPWDGRSSFPARCGERELRNSNQLLGSMGRGCKDDGYVSAGGHRPQDDYSSFECKSVDEDDEGF